MRARLKEVTYTMREGATLGEVHKYIEENHTGEFSLKFKGNDVSVMYYG